ncbi:trypsin-1 isoform X1 [Folsomia candida]|uniref:trypsin-1 isoform X1 n=1 Tax=Folsomia candida TaxID=158441 RepID=UPI001604DD88|nr:trypsin-1 isoform X1 [Folsomia candida]
MSAMAALLQITTIATFWTLSHQKDSPAEFINLSTTTCGIGSQQQRSHRIIGGSDALGGEYPWTVSLQSKEGSHFCGGVILDRHHILTAAHCFIFHLYGRTTSTVLLNSTLIIAGTNDMKSSHTPGQRHTLSKLIMHPGFSYFYPDFHNDIALVRIGGRGFEWNSHVQPACLSTDNKSKLWGYVAGWGVQSREDHETGLLRDGRLKKVSLPIWSNSKCQEAYKSAGIDWITKPSHLCAGWKNGSKDSCSGDSGSALFVKSDTGRMVASGLVSGGEGCSNGIPGIYTRISYFLPWIKANLISL